MKPFLFGDRNGIHIITLTVVDNQGGLATDTAVVTITVDPVLLPIGAMTVSATETAAAITEEP